MYIDLCYFSVPPELTVVPERKPLVVAGQNLTLRCNASGDPRPNITWTKDGIPANQFNVSGGLLHLVHVQRKDLGSYRCTARNGYGSNATSVSIVSMQCKNKILIFYLVIFFLSNIVLTVCKPFQSLECVFVIIINNNNFM